MNLMLTLYTEHILMMMVVLHFTAWGCALDVLT
jgi:hypothetical protein